MNFPAAVRTTADISLNLLLSEMDNEMMLIQYQNYLFLAKIKMTYQTRDIVTSNWYINHNQGSNGIAGYAFEISIVMIQRHVIE